MGSFFVEWEKFCIFSLVFLFTQLKRISCAILVDILCRLADKLRLKPTTSDIILMNFISISGTDCTYSLVADKKGVSNNRWGELENFPNINSRGRGGDFSIL